MLITSDGIVIRMHTDEISTYGRQTQGVRVVRLNEGVNVVSLALTDRENEEEASTEAQTEETENQED
jgi:DNA gyrase subunit A